MSLSKKEKTFCESYVNGSNVEEALKAIGKSDIKEAHSFFQNPECMTYIKQLRNLKNNSATTINADVILGLKEIASNPNNKPADRIKAYELIGKHLGLFEGNTANKVNQWDLLTIEELEGLIGGSNDR